MNISVAKRGDGKRIFVDIGDPEDGTGLYLHVDTDDVDTYSAILNTRKLLAILRDHWDHPRYEYLNPEPRTDFPDTEQGWEDENRQWDVRNRRAQDILLNLAG